MNIYLQCILIAVLGAALKTWIKFASMRSKALQANVKFDWLENARLDWPAWVSTLIAIAICTFFIDEALDYNDKIIYYVKPFFATLGYMGADLLIYFFGAANKYINRIIDIKTTIADTQRGTVHEPTQLPKLGSAEQVNV